ncbi:TMEM165/GDT1 family protein [Nocardia goodfellowii]|uniref:GDT1 family protein n=1 Tax=Nocardia goodfellowii TaxID=882446 RepID=A0ABS4Q8Z2_9NOCA|nr:TMEM165/GDT1 family protein [Nocardia goodfellowii]MBP2188161.1 putative Ca2+/H+ antiporter (TMEM165/GDT1 family) [Nocardia goodfellowii]
MIATILLSIGIVFLAELGDKSQLMALTFALRYRWWVVLAGIATATALVHIISVAVGHFLGAALPTTAIALVAALMFLGVGLWTLRENLTEDDGDEPKPPRSSKAPYFVVLSAFLLAELGDRTMFATAALATDNNWFAVWLGSTLGMVAADALAIVVGIVVGKHLPERAIGIAAGLLFLYFGSATLLATVLPGLGLLAGAALAVLVPAAAGAFLLARRTRRRPQPELVENVN